VGSIKKLVKSAIKDNNIEGDPLEDGVAVTAKFVADSVESSEINNGTVTGDDLASTLDISSKTVTLPNTGITAAQLSNTLDLSSKTLTLPDDSISFAREQFNVALLGFKMAVTENLTVFNLLDGIVDEFHDESGTDEGEGSNDNYCASSDFYNNRAPAAISAGFTTTSITEADTSTAGTNPTYGSGGFGTFTVPSCLTATTVYAWGSGGGAQGSGTGGGGGFMTGVLATTPGQAIKVVVGEGGHSGGSPGNGLGGGGSGGSSQGGGGGGLSGAFNDSELAAWTDATHGLSAPLIFGVAGSGGGGQQPSTGGAGGGQQGQSGSDLQEPVGHGEQVSAAGCAGGGGSQSAGGEGGGGLANKDGGFLFGGSGNISLAEPVDDTGPQYSGGGGSGYYGGGAARRPSGEHSAGGGGSSYFGHPQITSGSTEEGNVAEGGGTANPNYVASTNEGGASPSGAGEDGYMLFTGTAQATVSSTIISNAFTAGSVPSSTRIVVFQENIESPTLNTDIIASVSRNGGSNFTNVTLADSGYVTGSSGQRILTGQATISGQPSGQSMRWKLALANKGVKIHGVSLSWA